MKILLTAINAKYIHSNLAVYDLQAYARKELAGESPVEVKIREYTINQQPDEILGSIYEEQADVLCLSCYIWNLQTVELLVRDLSRIRPGFPIWLGGPEVSYDSRDVLRRLPQVKGVMKGEGEETFACLCRLWGKGDPSDEDLAGVEGITFRRLDGQIIENPWRELMDLDQVPFVYQDLERFENKILYYESSRGCPFSCSYCLSSVDKKLRFRSFSLVKEELQFFLDRKVPQVKFVDRTFNCGHAHAREIWQYIRDHDNGVTNFHFEVSADLLNEEELELLETMRPGLVQLEIGVQSTNPRTIREIRRTMDLEKVARATERIRQQGNIHQHLDLIAGLPYEDLASFTRSFDQVYRMKPHQLQLGFLKVLKGSWMKEQEKAYGLVCKWEPPYEVLRTRWLSYEDIRLLKGVEEMTEVYYNSRQFEYTMEELEREFASPFRMYEALWDYYRKKRLEEQQHRRSARYEILLGFLEERIPGKREYFRELLVYDYYLRENAKSRPGFAGEETVPAGEARAFYEREEKERTFLPAYEGFDKKQLRRMTHLERFPQLGKTVLFDYLERSPLTGEARTCILEGNRKEENITEKLENASCKNGIKSIE